MKPVTTALLGLLTIFSTPGSAEAQSPVRSGSSTAVLRSIDCVNGSAAGYSCANLQLVSLLPRSGMAGPVVNEIWGWTDPLDDKEYAIIGHHGGTNFVDVTDPLDPIYLGNLPVPAGASSNQWRDLKTYQDHVFIVGDNAGPHGMQVFDLTQLRSVASPPVTFSMTTHFTEVGSAHNIAINENTGFAYVMGDNSACGNGLFMIDISTPKQPVSAGCFNDGVTGISSAGYTHDAQCVVYHGPDSDYANKEICFTANESDITIVNVDDKSNPSLLSYASYPAAAYVHQGWLTEDHRYFIQGDELDEFNGAPTRTLIWDVTELDDPILLKQYSHPSQATDHNLYVKGNFVFAANYESGLRIIDISDIANPTEIAFFDTVQNEDDPGFSGAWGSYPFLPSGNILVSSAQEGLFIVRPSGFSVETENPLQPVTETNIDLYPNPSNDQITIRYTSERSGAVEIVLFDAAGRQVLVSHSGLLPSGSTVIPVDTSALPAGTYFTRLTGDGILETKSFTVIH